MLYTWSFYVAAAIFSMGIIWRITTFFKLSIGPDQTRFSPVQRIRGLVYGCAGTLISPVHTVKLLKSVILDVVLQLPLMIRDPLKWFMHISIYWGFAGLLFFHALEGVVSERLFSNYASTLNPFMALRNITGVMVILGIAIAVYRRKTHFRLSQLSKKIDYIAIFLLGFIMISGFCLEASKIISSGVFDDMMVEWGDMVYEDELPALQAFWQENFNVRFPGPGIPVTPELLEQGEALHDDNCGACHSPPQSAFVSYAISHAMGPMADVFNRHRLDRLLLKLHFLSCFIGLAYLPFSKFLHILTTPVSLLVHGVFGQQIKRGENRDTRRVFDLHACTGCGTCTLHCAVAPVHDIMGGKWVFPSERLASIRESAPGAVVDAEHWDAFSQGSFICTLCNKCSGLCPAGLNLQDIWQATRRRFEQDALPDPAVRVRDLQEARRLKRRLKSRDNGKPARITSEKNSLIDQLKDSFQSDSFSQCFTCLTCSNSCPLATVQDRTTGFGSAPPPDHPRPGPWTDQTGPGCPCCMELPDLLPLPGKLSPGGENHGYFLCNQKHGIRPGVRNMIYALFSGCRTGSDTPQYPESARAVLSGLGIRLVEPDFNCCGYPLKEKSLDAFLLLAIRNLAIAQARDLPVLTLCKCCYGALKQADHQFRTNGDKRKMITQMLKKEGLHYDGSARIHHILTVLDREVGKDLIQQQITHPFQKVNIAPSYGCHALRPSTITGFDRPDAPTIFERIIQLTGAEPLPWSKRLECCGSPLRDKNTALSADFIRQKLESAEQEGADMICTACNYCHPPVRIRQATDPGLRISQADPFGFHYPAFGPGHGAGTGAGPGAGPGRVKAHVDPVISRS